VLVSICRLALQISAVVFYGLEGFLVLEAFIYCLSIILMHFFGNLRLRSQWDYRILKSLLVTGFPLMLMSLIGMLANTLDRWFVLESSGIEGMATYSVAIYIGTLIMILPNQALSIVSRYTREMLAHGYNVELMKSLYWVIMKVFTVTWGVVCIVVLIAGYFIIYKYLPQYHDALQLLPLIIILSLLRSDVGIFGNYHIITGNQRLVLNSNVLAVITIIILNLLLILSLDYGLAGILSVSLLAALMQLLYLILMRSDHDINKHRRTIYVLSLCFFYVITYFLIFESLDNEIVDYMKFFAGFISLLLVSGVLLVAMYRKGEFEEIIRMAHRRNLSSNIES